MRVLHAYLAIPSTKVLSAFAYRRLSIGMIVRFGATRGCVLAICALPIGQDNKADMPQVRKALNRSATS